MKMLTGVKLIKTEQVNDISRKQLLLMRMNKEANYNHDGLERLFCPVCPERTRFQKSFEIRRHLNEERHLKFAKEVSTL